jgi:fructan beta-fructosidase
MSLLEKVKIGLLTKLHFALLLSLISCAPLTAQFFTEPYRPQYHISPTFGFMGDPNGPIKYKGKYHLFWWGHLRSDDLVHWEQLNTNALNGTPGGYGNWSGSVVVDKKNTASFNTATDTAMIAVYTLHQNSTNIQQQALSVSLNHVSFQYYSNNPIIPYNRPDFRDPQVFWHEPTRRWVMVVTKPIDRAIEIFSSENLKVWNFESIFNDRGAKREVWEVPDLFPLPLNNDTNNIKWVMTCGMGPNRMQYWVGNFDGSTFKLDTNDNLLSGKHVRGKLFANFENGFGNWTVAGTAFGNQPTSGTLLNQQTVDGFTGFGYLNSYHGGDSSTGKMTSPNFLIDKRYINLQIGGGSLTDVGVNIVVGNQVVETIKNTSNSERMQWQGIDISKHLGKNARLEIFDNATGSWGHILVDHIVFSDVQYDSRVENANWMDWGADFYAHKTFRNYDADDKRIIGLAWMGNWAYAQSVPTSPWKGCQSIPKELKLVDQGNGYELIQKPISELQTIRHNAFSQNNFKINQGNTSIAFDPGWNVFELKISCLIENENQKFGINVAEGTNQKIVISYDAKSSNLTIDRTNTPFNYAFKQIEKIPVNLSDDRILDLHIFVDQSSIEIFSEGYKYNLTSLAFTEASKHGISLFSENGSVEVKSMEAWRLQSIWGVQTSVEQGSIKNETHLDIYPNPVKSLLRLSVGTEQSAIPLDVKIFDMSGRLLLQKNKFLPTDSLDVSILPSGLYFLRINNGEKTAVSRFFKE